MNCLSCSAKLRPNSFKCRKCKSWNFQSKAALEGRKEIQRLSEVKEDEVEHIPTGPWDICFGVHYLTKVMGPVRGSTYLIGGVPGAGKSTLSLQLSDALAGALKKDVIYIAAEEKLTDVKLRGVRLQLKILNIFLESQRLAVCKLN